MAKITKADLVKFAIHKVQKMSVKELNDFLKLKEQKEIPEDFVFDLSYFCHSYNNTDNGTEAGGGELYRRAIVYIKTTKYSIKDLEITVKWFVPSSYVDGNVKEERPYIYQLTAKDIDYILKLGKARDYFESLFNIKHTLSHKNELPYTHIPQKWGGK